MPYKLIEGEVRLYYTTTLRVGSRPDGDSVWFKPDNPVLLSDINQRSAKFNKGAFTQLRFEGIDALELHFPGSDHQLKTYAIAARDFLLEKIGFTPDKIEYVPNVNIPTTVRSSQPIFVRAHILTRAIDPYGRPVAFVFPGNAPQHSKSDIFLDVKKLNTSLNAKLLEVGLVYPAYYSARDVNGQRIGGLPWDLRAHLTTIATNARNKKLVLWPKDMTTNKPQVTRKSDLHNIAIWPKLYRRLAKYFDDPKANHKNLTGFLSWLHSDRSERDDLLLVLSIGEILNLSDILTITNNSIKMNYSPEDLVIVPR